MAKNITQRKYMHKNPITLFVTLIIKTESNPNVLLTLEKNRIFNIIVMTIAAFKSTIHSYSDEIISSFPYMISHLE